MIAFVTLAYSVLGAVLVLFFIPQIIAVYKDRHGAMAISLSTWIVWTLYAVASVLYALLVVQELPFTLVSVGNLLGSATVLLLSAYKRWTYLHARRRLVA